LLLNTLQTATKRKKSPLIWSVTIAVFILSLFTPAAHAARFDEQIKQLKQNSSNAAQDKQQLGREAATLKSTITDLKTEIIDLDKQINHTTGKIRHLNNDIHKAKKDLSGQRHLLGLNMRKVYTEQDISTLEMLASSKNFSHFVDQEQYHANVHEKIDIASHRIETLMDQLDGEKKSVENLMTDQKAMQANVNSRRKENTRLLGLNKRQQHSFQKKLNANSAKIAALHRQQAAINQRGVVGGKSRINVARTAPRQKRITSGTQYPWPNVRFPNTIVDPWGMYKRQCVSYTAWRVASSGRHMPYWGGRGNAKNWDDNARRAGIPVSRTPHRGDVAISNAGTYGHAMYVEAVNNDGTVSVSQYNAHWDGRYSESRRYVGNLVFIHFR